MAFLVGMQNFPATVQRYEHIASRVARIVHMHPLTLDDINASVKAKSEVAITPELVKRIASDCQGRMRLLLNAIANIEMWADANGWTEVDVQHVKGLPLCTDFSEHLVARKGAV